MENYGAAQSAEFNTRFARKDSDILNSPLSIFHYYYLSSGIERLSFISCQSSREMRI